jgi:hypothetical protein
VSDTYFCSELVAAALKHMGLLPRYPPLDPAPHPPSLSSSLNSGYFWPGCFAKGDELDNLMISSLGSYGPSLLSPSPPLPLSPLPLPAGDELILDCRVMEISRAVEKRPSHLIKSSFEPSDPVDEEQVLPPPPPPSGLSSLPPPSRLLTESCAQREGDRSSQIHLCPLLVLRPCPPPPLPLPRRIIIEAQLPCILGWLVVLEASWT